MLRKVPAICVGVMLAASLASAADTHSSRGNLSAAEIVDKNVAARGDVISAVVVCPRDHRSRRRPLFERAGACSGSTS